MNTLQKSFNATMRRESKTITVNGAETKVVFRKNDDSNNETNRLNILYPIESNINQGSRFTFRGKEYLVLNKETSENDVYYKSSVIAMNCTITDNATSNKKYRNINCYCGGLTSSVVEKDTMFSIVSGNVELLTTDDEISRQVYIDSCFNEFGGTYKVTNIFYQNGIAYIYAERTVNTTPTVNYTVTYGGNSSVCVDDGTYQLVFNAYEDDTKVDGATFTYTSSDETVATVDTNGLMTLLKDGTVTITATWTDHTDVTCSTDITITQSVTPTIKGTSKIVSSYTSIDNDGIPVPFTAKFYDGNGNEVTGVTPVWTLPDCTFVDKLTITYVDNVIKIATEDENITYETFKLHLEDSNGEYTSSEIEIEITQAY